MTTTRRRIRRWHSPTLFALIALCFFLPFATVSCDDASTTFTGVQLVTHTVPQGGVLADGEDIGASVEHSGSLIAAEALAATLLGLALGVYGLRKGPGWCASIVFLALLWLLWRVIESLADFNLHSGYVLALLLSAWAALLHARRAWRRRWRHLDRQLAKAEANITAGNVSRALRRLERASFDFASRGQDGDLAHIRRLAEEIAATGSRRRATNAQRDAARRVAGRVPRLAAALEVAYEHRHDNRVEGASRT